MPDERDVGSQAGDALVDALEGLQVGNVHRDGKSLLEGVADGGRFREDAAQAVFDLLRHGERKKHAAADFHGRGYGFEPLHLSKGLRVGASTAFAGGRFSRVRRGVEPSAICPRQRHLMQW